MSAIFTQKSELSPKMHSGLTGRQLYCIRSHIERGSNVELNKFLTRYLPFVYLIAKQYTTDDSLLIEYIKVANMGLLFALEKVNSNDDEKFFYAALSVDVRNVLISHIERSHQVKQVPYLFLSKNIARSSVHGVVVLMVLNPAVRKCPLKKNDIILHIDGIIVESLEDINRILMNLKKNDIFEVTFSRAGVVYNVFLNCEL